MTVKERATKMETKTLPILVDDPEEGPQNWAWVPVADAADPDAAVAYLSETAPIDDPGLRYFCHGNREWLSPDGDPLAEDCRWNRSRNTDPGAAEFWLIEVDG